MAKVDTIAGHNGLPRTQYDDGYISPAQRDAKINYALIEHNKHHYLVDSHGYTIFVSRFRFLRNLVSKMLTLPAVYDAGVVDG